MDAVDRVRAGDIRATARLMTDLECNMPSALDALRDLYSHTGKAHIVGITGAPGVGKSTLIDGITRCLRHKGLTVGILAIDPTSPFTGGALLGDRVRMEKHNADAGVFIRSLGTRGVTGGLSRATLGMTHMLDAMGKDMVIIETVGIGQQEIDITRIVDTAVLVLVPGMGDTIQLMKAGILEAADIFVINKASKEGAETLMVELEGIMSTRRRCPVLMAEAVLNQGIEEITEAIIKHKQDLIACGGLELRRKTRASYELMSTLDGAIKGFIDSNLKDEILMLAEQIAERKLDPYTAAEGILTKLVKSFKDKPSSPYKSD